MLLRILVCLMAVAGLTVAMSNLSLAQGLGIAPGSSDNPNGPTVSPYLNLLNTNTLGVTNYQSLVKPLVNQNNALRNQGQAIRGLQQQFNAGSFGGATGRPSYFMNYSHFYPSATGR